MRDKIDKGYPLSEAYSRGWNYANKVRDSFEKNRTNSYAYLFLYKAIIGSNSIY